jgi:vacuolar iron transporter family protein
MPNQPQAPNTFISRGNRAAPPTMPNASLVQAAKPRPLRQDLHSIRSFINDHRLQGRALEPNSDGPTLRDLQEEHGVHLGSRLDKPRGELTEQSPVRNYVRDLVLGFNDGVVSVYAITAGVAGAAFGSPQILITGVAASIAGALSMAAGEFISTKSQAEFYASERKREEEHLTRWPHLEVQELRESLHSKGFEPPLLDQAVDAIASDRKRFLDYMMREEFGIGEESERSPVRAAILILLAFLVGAFCVVLPYATLQQPFGLYGSSALSLVALFLAGVGRARASRLPPFKAGVEMVFIGVFAASVSFFVGLLLGVSI